MGIIDDASTYLTKCEAVQRNELISRDGLACRNDVWWDVSTLCVETVDRSNHSCPTTVSLLIQCYVCPFCHF